MRVDGEPSAFFGWRAESCAGRRCCIGGTGFHITAFEPSYLERGRRGGSEHGWRWAAGESTGKSNRIFHSDHID
jgi:hypothetical protein